jgi:chromate transporter
MKIYWEMFYSFLKIGAFTIGGGYAMVPLIEAEVVHKKKWIREEEFLDALALAQSAPGPIAINTAVFVGFQIKKYKGVFFTTLGAILPSFFIILAIATLFRDIRDLEVVEKAFKGIRPVVVALIASSVYSLSKSAKLGGGGLLVAVGVAALVAVFGLSPIFAILGGILGGNVYQNLQERQKK